jgi:hypothetical protein
MALLVFERSQTWYKPQPRLDVNQLDSTCLNCPMNSRATAIPNRNSWLKGTTPEAALRWPSGPAIRRPHGPPASEGEGVPGLKSQEGLDAYSGLTAR